jgi:hypothetical protein
MMAVYGCDELVGLDVWLLRAHPATHVRIDRQEGVGHEDLTLGKVAERDLAQ